MSRLKVIATRGVAGTVGTDSLNVRFGEKRTFASADQLFALYRKPLFN